MMMKSINHKICDLHNHFWKLADGRIWSTADAKFVSAKTAKTAGYDTIPDSPVDEHGQHSIEGLQQALVFYDLPRGELATPEDIREERDARLYMTDYLVMPDYPIDADKLELVKAYRTALRDLPEQEGFPSNVVWPDKPEV